MDQHGYYWVYPELRQYATFMGESSTDHMAYEYESSYPFTPPTDPTLRILEYATKKRRNPQEPQLERPSLHDLVELIQLCDPNRPLYRDSILIDTVSTRRKNRDAFLFDKIRFPQEKGAPNVTLFHVFLHKVLNERAGSREPESTYVLLNAFLERGITWSLNLCHMVSLSERETRHRITEIEARLRQSNLADDYDSGNETDESDRLDLGNDQRKYAALLPLYTQIGTICKEMGARTIMSNPIFLRFMRSPGGPFERAWHPKTGKAFLAYVRDIPFSDRH